LAEASRRSGWAFRPVPPEPCSITELIRTGTLDAELAATIWLLVEGRVPLIVAAGGRGIGKTTLLAAFLDFLPRGLRVVELRGVDETFDWLPQASELGWHGVPARPLAGPPVRPDDTVLLAAELSDHTPAYTWGEAARLTIRAASIGYGLAATIHGDSLEDVFADLTAHPVALTDDELSRLGVIVVLSKVGGRRRVVAAHFVRPVVRDAHGHVQRLGPAVLATWNAATDTFEHFGWGVTPELAARVGRRPGDFEVELSDRTAFLERLVGEGITGVAEVRANLASYHGPTATIGTSDPMRGSSGASSGTASTSTGG
jgi:hypothetical protein